MTNYNDGRWHGWNASGKPEGIHPESIIEHYSNSTSNGLYHGIISAKCIVFPWVKVFRVVKEYREPREGYVVTTLFETASDAKIVYPGCTPIKVREVIE